MFTPFTELRVHPSDLFDLL